ncbi:MAG: VCBS repeat-containing protein [Planctomycetes bacterium]|nr:VCBS repeat-containing protein [Planctomycetota bacterium]
MTRPSDCAALAAAIACANVALARPQGIQYAWPTGPGVAYAASAGDVDADGIPDVLVGEPGSSSASIGVVRVRSGSTGAELYSLAGLSAGDGFGSGLQGIGDVDHDGRADFVVAAANPLGGVLTPYVQLRSGLAGAVLWQLASPAPATSFGHALARLRDVDGDGVDELAIAFMHSVSTGRVLVVSGVSGAVLTTISPPAGATSSFARAIANAGDVDQDGVEDLLVGDPDSGGGAASIGRVTLHSGATGLVVHTIVGPVPGGAFGNDVAGLGDVDGDGVPDFVVGAPNEPIIPSFNSGRARLYSGATGAQLLAIQDGPNLIHFGEGVDRAPDLDGDGRADVLLGAGLYRFGANGFYPAEARVHSSVTGQLLEWGLVSSPGLTTIPDANGDGIEDFIAPGVSLASGLSLALALHAQPGAWPTGCPGKTTSQGCTPVIGMTGAPSPTIGDPLAFIAAGVVPSSYGTVLWSTTLAPIPFGGGTLCLGGALHRWPTVTTSGPSSISPCPSQQTGTLSVRVSRARLAATGLAPGQVFFVQAWFRDAGFAPPDDIGLSDALGVTLWP